MKKLSLYIVLAAGITGSLSIMWILPLKAQETPTGKVIRAGETTQYYHGSVQDLDWLQGSWQGEGLGGICQEVWEKPFGNTMMGMFKLIKEGKPVFYEFFVLVEEKGLIELRLKHFTSAFMGWETKDKFISFKLVEVKGHKAHFEGLTMEKIDDNHLRVYVAIKYEDGVVREELFEFERQS